MEKYKVSDLRTDLELPQNVTPEYLLWVAVVDRAIYDFCTFAEWYNARVTHTAFKKPKKRSNTPEISMMRELSALQWFIFDPMPREYNLQWIAENVFSCGAGICDEIRRRCIKGHKANLDKHASDPRVKPLLTVYEERTQTLVRGVALEHVDVSALARTRMRRVSSLH